MTLTEQTAAARRASYRTAGLPEETRNRALQAAAAALDRGRHAVLEANRQDVEAAQEAGLNQALAKRLVLNEKKLDAILQGLEDIRRLPDPLGRTLSRRRLDQDLILEQKTVPIGLIGVIFESRPDALVQIAGLALKSGNAVILKGGKEALHSNRILHRLLAEAAAETDPALQDSLVLAETRQDIQEILALDGDIDLLIPRGSNRLVQYIKENTRIPVLGHADGICHLYIDRSAPLDQAVALAVDSKCQYPAVCNAVETLLVHRDTAAEALPRLQKALEAEGVELRGSPAVRRIIDIPPASEADWTTEYNDLILSIALADSLEAAADHINRYGSHHTDAIVTADDRAAAEFRQRVDSASVMINASTRFADGFRYGLGAEVGISTNKIHARGPVGLEGLTIYQYTLTGTGQTVAPYTDGSRQFLHEDLPIAHNGPAPEAPDGPAPGAAPGGDR